MDDESLILRLQEISLGHWPTATATEAQMAKRLIKGQHLKGWQEEAQSIIDRITARPRKG